MASYFNLTLDTTAPTGGSISAPSSTGSTSVALTLGATGASQMNIWGDITGTDAYVLVINPTGNPRNQGWYEIEEGSEEFVHTNDSAVDSSKDYYELVTGSSGWITYSASTNVTLTTGDGTKTIYVKYRDDVGNESAAVSTTVILDTAGPAVTIIGPDVAKISKISGYNVSAFSFSADDAFVEWKVKVVPSSSSAHTAGTQIPTAGGSTNMSGNTTTAASTPVACTIYGADLEAASSGDGAKVIKVFVKDALNNWSA